MKKVAYSFANALVTVSYIELAASPYSLILRRAGSFWGACDDDDETSAMNPIFNAFDAVEEMTRPINEKLFITQAQQSTKIKVKSSIILAAVTIRCA